MFDSHTAFAILCYPHRLLYIHMGLDLSIISCYVLHMEEIF